MTIAIAPALLARLIDEAAATPAREICGLLFGSAAKIDAAQPTRNVAADPRLWFEVDPAALFIALRAERAGGPVLIGHYHSHPNGRAEPSPRDLAAAEPGRLWLIIGGGIARVWLAQAAGFREVTIVTDC